MAMADAKTFHLMIARVDGPVFDESAVSVTVPGTEGEMTVLSDHEPFISPLKEGTITIHQSDGTIESFACTSGTIEIGENEVSILL